MPPAVLLYAIPAFVILVVAEWVYSHKEQKQLYEIKDAFSSMALGIGNVLSGFVSKALVFGCATLIYQYRLFTLESSLWWVWVLAFFADDISYYWFHRSSHHVRFFWASHVVHHSSQHYNLAAALRQTWTGNFTGSFIFWMWMPLVGFHPLMVMLMQQFSLIYQFWIHTETINKMPHWFEFILNTPSHHRVHHATDLKYLDKNHGGILIIWDRLFGSFQPEEEKPTYGLTKNVNSFHPVKVAFHEWENLAKDIARGRSLSNAFKYLVNPPGWSHDGSSKTTNQIRNELPAVSIFNKKETRKMHHEKNEVV
ncbi:sterol desaturase family protein [Aridibaculum aurantiacum]|uniref:sterol desaturase family protein n=1 Tax=Aridibaculum aurantiacum TaxID=2810307 RepID=UPI001A97C01A|nr:sterol desaturase family protein [Aridibaculum aurantiacum]